MTMNPPTDQSSREQEREAFEAWWFNPASADNSKRYRLTVDEMRQMAEDVTWKAWQARAALSTLPPIAITAEEAGREGDGWLPIETAPEDEIVLVAAEFDHPGDWRMKCGYLDKQTAQWRVFGASWQPSMWRPMPTPPSHPGPLERMQKIDDEMGIEP